MKKALALIIALMMVLTLFVACDQKPKGTEAPTDPTGGDATQGDKLGSTLAGKTPEETYKAIGATDDTLDNYTVTVTTESSVDVSGEKVEYENVAEYKKSGANMYCKYDNASGVTEELWCVDGYMYYSGSDNKEKSVIDADTFEKYYFIDIANGVLTLETSAFEGKNFVTDGEIYILNFTFTPEEYKTLTGEIVKDNVKYEVCFDANGRFMYVKIVVNMETSGGYVVSETRKLELSKVGSTEQITVPGNTEEYREAPLMKDIDRSEIDGLDGVEISEDATDYIMIDVASYGKIVIRLFPEVAPKTVAAISGHVAAGSYDGTIFHRIVPDFVIQGGDTSTEGATGIFGEFNVNGFTNNLSHLRGVVSMARATAYNSGFDQFFIMLEDNAGLDGGYAAFGCVVYGMDVVDAIAAVETESEKPLDDVVITAVDFVNVL